MENFDYIVVGAGSSGSVIANRLSENNKIKICVIEAGGNNQHPYVKMPAGFIKTINDKRFNWCFKTEGSDYVNNREILFPRGKGYGGSSSINGHLYVRGQPDDYNQWAQLGNLGWSYDDVLPYFKKSEYKENGDEATRGKQGPLYVSDIVEKHPLCEEFIRGSSELGIQVQNDYNSGQQEGIFYYQRTIKNGTRFSAYDAFLKPAAMALGYGLLFSTVLILLFVPALYLIRLDIFSVLLWFLKPFTRFFSIKDSDLKT